MGRRRLTIEEMYLRYPEMLPGQTWRRTTENFWFSCKAGLGHPPYEQTFGNHSVRGCPKCANERKSIGQINFRKTKRGRKASSEWGKAGAALLSKVCRKGYEAALVEGHHRPFNHYGNHIYWHTNRAITNPKCRFCIEELEGLEENNAIKS